MVFTDFLNKAISEYDSRYRQTISAYMCEWVGVMMDKQKKYSNVEAYEAVHTWMEKRHAQWPEEGCPTAGEPWHHTKGLYAIRAEVPEREKADVEKYMDCPIYTLEAMDCIIERLKAAKPAKAKGAPPEETL